LSSTISIFFAMQSSFPRVGGILKLPAPPREFKLRFAAVVGRPEACYKRVMAIPGASTSAGTGHPRAGGPALAVLAAAVLLAAAFSAVQLFDSDTWIHLASGRLVWQGGIPSTNTFSFLFPEYPFRHVEWLFQATAYLSFLAGGAAGAVLFQVALASSAFLLSAAAFLARTRRIGWGTLLLVLPLVLFALAVCRSRFVLRPHLVSFLGIALLLYLWHARPRFLLPLAALTGAVWANSHPGVVYGLVLCGLFTLSRALARDGKGAGEGGLFLLAFFAGSLANPYLLHPYQYAWIHYRLEKVLPNIAEFAPPTLADNPAFFAYAALALIALPLRLREKDTLYPLVLAAFLIPALRAQREAATFAVASLPFLMLAASRIVEHQDGGWRRRTVQGAGVLLSVLALAAAAGECRRYQGFMRPGLGINRAVVPAGAVDFIRDRRLEGRMYNDFGNGGYLMWRLFPGRGVFQDGRPLAYPPGFLAEIQGGGRPLTADELGMIAGRYRLDGAVVTRALWRHFDSYADLFRQLGWKLTYLDGISAVYLRPGTPDGERMRDLEFVLLRLDRDPYALFDDGLRDPVRMKAEVARLDPRTFVLPADCFRFALAAWGCGDLASAGRFLRRGREIDPENPGWPLNLGNLEAATGRRAEARRWYREAVRLGPGTEQGRKAAEKMAALPAEGS
jgi:hypothetical protein